VLPTDADKQTVHDIIYQELCLGQFCEPSAAACLDVIHHLVDSGAEAVLLACTELGMLIPQAQAPVKLFDTMALHAQKAVELALQDH